MQENKPVLVVGLGNPGTTYARTRHNVGFMALDNLAGADATWKKEKNALTATMTLDGHRVILVKPQTYMNNSGLAVGAIMAFYKIPVDNLIVIHDDLDLAVGDMRRKIGGGSAGHNGIKSIDAAVGQNYHRIRIGIGHPRQLGLPMSPADWVLGKFDDAQIAAIDAAINNLDLFGN